MRLFRYSQRLFARSPAITARNELRDLLAFSRADDDPARIAPHSPAPRRHATGAVELDPVTGKEIPKQSEW